VLLRGDALVVEGDNASGQPRHVDDDEADAMPRDLGHDAAWLTPTLFPIAETGEVASHRVRYQAFQQIADPVFQNAVGRKPDRVADPLGFEELVDLGLPKTASPGKYIRFAMPR
jgi:hypothetical protein